MASTAALLNKLWDSPVGKQLQAEEIEQRATERQRHLQALVELGKQAAKELPGLLAARDKAEGDRRAALENVKISQQRFNQVFAAHQSASAHFGSELERHRRELESTADPAIDGMLDKLAAEIQRLQRLPAESTHETSRSIRTFGEPVVRTNRPSITARLAACFKARPVVQELKYQLLDGPDLAVRLHEIWRGLPEIGEPR